MIEHSVRVKDQGASAIDELANQFVCPFSSVLLWRDLHAYHKRALQDAIDELLKPERRALPWY